MVFVLISTTTVILCRRVSERICHLLFTHDLKVSMSRDLEQFGFQCWIEAQLHVVTCKSQAIDKDASACHQLVMNMQVTKCSCDLHLIVGSTKAC